MSNYKSLLNYKMPNRKKQLLTDDFLKTFKEELDKAFDVVEKHGISNYNNHYGWLGGTGGFYEALEAAAKKHNLSKAIYQYACSLPWYESDSFDEELLLIMIERNIMEMGEEPDIWDKFYSPEALLELEQQGKIMWTEKVVQKKGYRVKTRFWEYI